MEAFEQTIGALLRAAKLGIVATLLLVIGAGALCVPTNVSRQDTGETMKELTEEEIEYACAWEEKGNEPRRCSTETLAAGMCRELIYLDFSVETLGEDRWATLNRAGVTVVKQARRTKELKEKRAQVLKRAHMTYMLVLLQCGAGSSLSDDAREKLNEYYEKYNLTKPTPGEHVVTLVARLKQEMLERAPGEEEDVQDN